MKPVLSLAPGDREIAAQHGYNADEHASIPGQLRAYGLHDPRVANLIGVADFYAGRIHDAGAAFDRAASLSPATSAYTCNLGIAHVYGGRPEQALAALRRSLYGNALLPEAHYWAWAAFGRLGILRDVNARFRRALHNDPAQRAVPPRAQRLRLDAVTLCAIDCAVPELAARALRRSMAHCEFAGAKLFTSHAVHFDDIETVAVPHIGSIEEYCCFVMKGLPDYIETRYALVTQWDGYIVNGSAWSDDFLDCDYVGARWDGERPENAGRPPDQCVGNGGFSLRSEMFLRAGTDARIESTHPEDDHLCKTYRPLLEREYGIRFAPAATADRFSFEILPPTQIPFGFHGCFNIARFETDPKWMRFEFLGTDLAAPA